MILLIFVICFLILSYNLTHVSKTAINLIDLFDNTEKQLDKLLISFNRQRIDSPTNIQARQYIWFKLYEKLSKKNKISHNLQPIIKNFIEKLSGEIPVLLNDTGYILNIPLCLQALNIDR